MLLKTNQTAPSLWNLAFQYYRMLMLEQLLNYRRVVILVVGCFSIVAVLPFIEGLTLLYQNTNYLGTVNLILLEVFSLTWLFAQGDAVLQRSARIYLGSLPLGKMVRFLTDLRLLLFSNFLFLAVMSFVCLSGARIQLSNFFLTLTLYLNIQLIFIYRCYALLLLVVLINIGYGMLSYHFSPLLQEVLILLSLFISFRVYNFKPLFRLNCRRHNDFKMQQSQLQIKLHYFPINLGWVYLVKIKWFNSSIRLFFCVGVIICALLVKQAHQGQTMWVYDFTSVTEGVLVFIISGYFKSLHTMKMLYRSFMRTLPVKSYYLEIPNIFLILLLFTGLQLAYLGILVYFFHYACSQALALYFIFMAQLLLLYFPRTYLSRTDGIVSMLGSAIFSLIVFMSIHY